MVRLIRPTYNQWLGQFGQNCLRRSDRNPMQKFTTNILYDNTLYSNVELYMYMSKTQRDTFINVEIYAYGYLLSTQIGIYFEHCTNGAGEKVIEINLEHNGGESLIENTKLLVEDSYEFFSENLFTHTNVINFQQMFLAKTNILFNIPLLYAICKRAGLF